MFSDSQHYQNDIRYIANFDLNWKALEGNTILVTGATGLIGTVLVDSIMYKNKVDNTNIKLIVLSRNLDRLTSRFQHYTDEDLFVPVQGDVTDGFEINQKIDFIINLASNTHPELYATEPVGTIETIIRGSKNIFELASHHKTKRVINTSSVEIYGENRSQSDRFSENDCGYINCNTLRAGYTESKRLSETLSQAYISEKGLDIISARLGRVYGPTYVKSDTKSTTQFIKNAVDDKDIILKSAGKQRYSYVYVADAVTALLLLLVNGACGEAYNIAGDEDLTLREIAEMLASNSQSRVKVEMPNEIESKGFSVVQNALMDCKKIKSIGWSAEYSLEAGLGRTVEILKEL